MIRVVPDVGVHQANGKRLKHDHTQTSCQILSNVARRVADSVHDCTSGLVLEHRHGREILAEARTARRIVQRCLPAVERIVVAMTDERAYPGIVEPFQTIDELELRAEAPICRIVHVAGDEQRVHALVDTQFNDVLVGGKRRVVQRARHVFRGNGFYADEGAVEVQICGMYEADTGHIPSADCGLIDGQV